MPYWFKRGSLVERKQETNPWTDDFILWMQKKKYDEVKRLVEDRDTWRKMTDQPSDREDCT